VPQSVTLYSEFLPKQARGRCIMMIEIFWAVGTCAEVILGKALFWLYYKTWGKLSHFLNQ